MRINDFMDLKKLQNIQDQFADATGLAAIAVDEEGNYITKGSNCADFAQDGPKDFTVDIVVEGQKVGSMIGGQVPGAENGSMREAKAVRGAAALLEAAVNQIVNQEYRKHSNSRHSGTFDEELELATQTVELINQKTKELDGIATKQNILSLNASIESARAGVAGAGFAVVAKQMGELAAQSAEIYREISDSALKIKVSVEKMNYKNH